MRTISGEQDTLHWILSDHLGSLNVTANEDGAWNSEIRYTAFGEVRWKDGITPTDYRYTGQLEQAELGLYFYVARFYDAEIAHFVQADSIVPQPGNAVTYDRYAYTRNNPIRFNDPSGHDVGCPGRDASQCGTGPKSTTSKPKLIVGGGSSGSSMADEGFKVGGSDPTTNHMTAWNETTLLGYDITYSQYLGYVTADEMGNQVEGNPKTNPNIGKSGQALKLFNQYGMEPNTISITGYSSSTHSGLFFTEMRSTLRLKTNLILLGPPGYEGETNPLAWDYNGNAMYRQDFIDRVLNLSPDLVQILIYDDNSGNWSEIEQAGRTNITYRYYGANGSGSHQYIDDDPAIVREAVEWLSTR